MSRSLCLDSLSDDELLERLATLVATHRRLDAEVVAHIAEVDTRRLYLGKACSSMFAYAVEVLQLSEHEAYLRITCARASRRFPMLLDMLADGRLHLSAIAKLAPHLKADNAEALLARAVHRTTRQIEELVSEVAPREDVPASVRKLPSVRSRRKPAEQLGTHRVPGATAPASARSLTSTSSTTADAATTAALFTDPDPTASSETGPEVVEAPAARTASTGTPEAPRAVVEPIAPARYRVQFTASAELRDKLCRAKDLLRHKDPNADLGDVIDEAVTLLLGKLEAKRFGKTQSPRKTLADTDTSASSRHVPAAVKRAVFERDQGQCAYVDEATGRRCSCTDPGRLEYHHRTPFARGCHHDPDRIELRCRAHNVHQAELDFGPETMSRYRTGSSRAREPQPVYGTGAAASSGPPNRSKGGKLSEQRLARSRQVESPKREPPSARRRRSPWCGLRASPTRETLRALPGCAEPPSPSIPVGRRFRPRSRAWRPARRAASGCPAMEWAGHGVLRRLAGERAGCAAIPINCALSDRDGG